MDDRPYLQAAHAGPPRGCGRKRRGSGARVATDGSTRRARKGCPPPRTRDGRGAPDAAEPRGHRGPATASGGGRGAGCATMSVLSVFDSPWPRATNPGSSSTSSTPGFSGRPCEEPSPRAVLGDLEHTLYRDTYARTCGTSPRPGGRRARGGDASRCRLGGYVQCGSRRRRAGRRRRRRRPRRTSPGGVRAVREQPRGRRRRVLVVLISFSSRSHLVLISFSSRRSHLVLISSFSSRRRVLVVLFAFSSRRSHLVVVFSSSSSRSHLSFSSTSSVFWKLFAIDRSTIRRIA